MTDDNPWATRPPEQAEPIGQAPPVELCSHCYSTLKPGAAFCARCGRATARHAASASMSMRLRSGDVRMVLWYFMLTLAVAAVWMVYARVTEDAFVTTVGASASLLVVTIAFAIPNRSLVAEPLSRAGFGIRGYALILVAAVPIVALVGGYVEALHAWFGLHVEGELSAFDGRSVLWPIVLIVLLPPLEEELAFRGLIYAGLRKSFTVSETFIVSAFAFAIVHLSIPSLVTHFPLGLYFVWLRHRSGSLWPGVFAHLCHNLGVCLMEWS